MRRLLCLALLTSMIIPYNLAGAACVTYKVRLFTTPLAGIPSLCLFELTSSGPGDEVHFSNIMIDGHESPIVRTFGGPVEGRLAQPGSSLDTSIIHGQSGFLSGAVLSLDSLQDVIQFDVSLIDSPDAAAHPARFAFYLNGITVVPFFPTADPTGAHALFTITETDSCEEVTAYAPCRFAPPDSIVLEASGIIGIIGVPEPAPAQVLRVLQAGPNPAHGAFVVKLDAPVGALDFRVFDLSGRIVHRERAEHSGGNLSFTWMFRDERGARVAPGVYFAQVSNQRKSITRKIVIAP